MILNIRIKEEMGRCCGLELYQRCFFDGLTGMAATKMELGLASRVTSW